jgi:hypothetical protein
VRIYEDADFRLVVTDSSIGLSLVLFAAGTLLLIVALFGSRTQAQFGLTVSACFFLFCAMLLLRTTRFVFDRAQRTLTWQRRRFLSRSSGQVPFDDIRGVVVETTGLAGGEGGSYRLALATASGAIPFSDAYRPNRSRHESMRDRIVAFVGLGNAPSSGTASAENDLRELVRQRRIVDAVALLRARENVGLTEARRRIAEIEKQMAAH